MPCRPQYQCGLEDSPIPTFHLPATLSVDNSTPPHPLYCPPKPVFPRPASTFHTSADSSLCSVCATRPAAAHRHVSPSIPPQLGHSSSRVLEIPHPTHLQVPPAFTSVFQPSTTPTTTTGVNYLKLLLLETLFHALSKPRQSRPAFTRPPATSLQEKAPRTLGGKSAASKEPTCATLHGVTR